VLNFRFLLFLENKKKKKLEIEALFQISCLLKLKIKKNRIISPFSTFLHHATPVVSSGGICIMANTLKWDLNKSFVIKRD
jgi:hypothetical protein